MTRQMPVRRYTFDTSFEADELERDALEAALRQQEEEPAPPEPVFTDAQVEEARQEGFTAGHAQGVAETTAAFDHHTAQVLDALGAELARASAAITEAQTQARDDALSLAVALARRIAPSIEDRDAEDRLTSFLRQTLTELNDEPRVVIRLGVAQAERLGERLSAKGGEVGFAGQIITIAEPELGAGDCRIEWADGGLEQKQCRKLEELDELVAAFFAAAETEANRETECEPDLEATPDATTAPAAPEPECQPPEQE